MTAAARLFRRQGYHGAVLRRHPRRGRMAARLALFPFSGWQREAVRRAIAHATETPETAGLFLTRIARGKSPTSVKVARSRPLRAKHRRHQMRWAAAETSRHTVEIEIKACPRRKSDATMRPTFVWIRHRLACISFFNVPTLKICCAFPFE